MKPVEFISWLLAASVAGLLACLIKPSANHQPKTPPTYCDMEVTYREIKLGELVESSLCMELVLRDEPADN